MPERNDRSIIPHKGGFFNDISLYLRLVLRLLLDRRVNFFLKLIPLASLVYLFFPDIAPGPIDDAALIGLSFYLFVELCPADIVEEHMAALIRTIAGEWHEPQKEIKEEDIIEGEFRDEV